MSTLIFPELGKITVLSYISPNLSASVASGHVGCGILGAIDRQKGHFLKFYVAKIITTIVFQ